MPHPLVVVGMAIYIIVRKCMDGGNTKSNSKVIPNAMQCPKCGRTYDSSWEVCLQCRTQLAKKI